MSIDLERSDAVLIVTINRPQQRNALDDYHNEQLAAALMTHHEGIRAIVLTGAGPAAFCSGADLKTRLPGFQRSVAGGATPTWSFGGITGDRMSPVPIIAAVNGHAIAGGLELALACDLRICTPDASFAMTEVRWGITPGAGGTQRLPQVVARGLAVEMLLGAETINAVDAHRSGLVNRVVDQEVLVSSAISIAESIARNAPLAVRAVREALHAQSATMSNLHAESELFYATMRTRDAHEGSTAFAERRPPSYTGE
jgi:enoyl-CoA hydratase/carnithine racemase